MQRSQTEATIRSYHEPTQSCSATRVASLPLPPVCSGSWCSLIFAGVAGVEEVVCPFVSMDSKYLTRLEVWNRIPTLWEALYSLHSAFRANSAWSDQIDLIFREDCCSGESEIDPCLFRARALETTDSDKRRSVDTKCCISAQHELSGSRKSSLTLATSLKGNGQQGRESIGILGTRTEQ